MEEIDAAIYQNTNFLWSGIKEDVSRKGNFSHNIEQTVIPTCTTKFIINGEQEKKNTCT